MRRMRTLFRRAVSLHPVAWLALLAVFALFVWLNFSATRVAYLAKSAGGWRGGVREGFPIPWWDCGSEASATVDNAHMILQTVPYGGWRLGGIAIGLLMFFVALTVTGALAELLVRRFQTRTAKPGGFDPFQRPVRIRLLTGLVSLILVLSFCALNLIAVSSISDSGLGSVFAIDDAAPSSVTLSETMGWPFVTYIARNPVLVSAQTSRGAPMSAQQELAYFETHAPLHWGYTHWNLSAFALNAVCALLCIAAAAFACEWFSHPRSSAAP